MSGLMFFWLLVRIIDQNVMAALMSGNWQTAVDLAKVNMQNNYAGSGATTTYSVLIALVIFTAMLKFVGVKSPVRGVSMT